MKQSIRKFFIATGIVAFLAVSLTSCHSKEGCPNKITQTKVIGAGDNT